MIHALLSRDFVVRIYALFHAKYFGLGSRFRKLFCFLDVCVIPWWCFANKPELFFLRILKVVFNDRSTKETPGDLLVLPLAQRWIWKHLLNHRPSRRGCWGRRWDTRWWGRWERRRGCRSRWSQLQSQTATRNQLGSVLGNGHVVRIIDIGSDSGMVRVLDTWSGCIEYSECHPLSAAGTVVDPCCIRLPKQMKKQ